MLRPDEKDMKLLALLKENSRLTTSVLSKKLDMMPQTTVHNRIKKLKKLGVIKRFTIDVDRKQVGRGLMSFILCTVSYRTATGQKTNQHEIARQIKALPEVEDVSIVTGEIDLIVKVSLKDVDELNDFVISKLRDIEGIERTITSVVLSEPE
ncbi:MAG: Lrp/AsnC family transcriptional regulator [Candidatus Thorarchaeota archaeon]